MSQEIDRMIEYLDDPTAYLTSSSSYPWTEARVYLTSAPIKAKSSDISRFLQIAERNSDYDSGEIESDIAEAFEEYRSIS